MSHKRKRSSSASGYSEKRHKVHGEYNLALLENPGVQKALKQNICAIVDGLKIAYEVKHQQYIIKEVSNDLISGNMFLVNVILRPRGEVLWATYPILPNISLLQIKYIEKENYVRELEKWLPVKEICYFVLELSGN